MRPVLLFLPLFLALPARACLNDRDSDSLATQAAKFPDTLRVITGRFERNPPLFYQMRIRRELAQLQKSPRDFAKYDDIAVAFDKLHRDDEALQIMAKKRALLPAFDAKNPAGKEAWYRYFANAGTFHAHHYLGEKSGDLSEMKTARAMIARAIEIKPNAHFGREKYQLMAMDWILATKSRKTKLGFSDWIHARSGYNPDQEIKGLSGLIVLGAAWESVDVFDALAESLKTQEGVTLSYFSLLRTQEILKQGRNSLTPHATNLRFVEEEMTNLGRYNAGAAMQPKNQETLQELFPKLRAEAESWNTARQNYMLTRLQKGDHPDTNPKFWANWKPAAPPSLDVSWFNQGQERQNNINRLVLEVKIAAALFLSGILALIFWLVRRARFRRLRARSVSSP